MSPEETTYNVLDEMDQAWAGTEAAAPGASQFGPLPRGAEVKVFVLEQNCARVGQNETAVCKVTFEVAEGEHVGKRIWHDFWVTMKNIGYLKRDLGILSWKGEKISQLMDPNDSSLMYCGALILAGAPEEYRDRDDNPREKSTIYKFLENYEYTPSSAEPSAEGNVPAAAPAKGAAEEDIPF